MWIFEDPPPAIAIFSQILARIFVAKIRSITVQMGTAKAHLSIQFFLKFSQTFLIPTQKTGLRKKFLSTWTSL